MEGTIAVKSALMVKYNSKMKIWNYSVIVYEYCVVYTGVVAWEFPM